jgi:hemolysin activation/secretion protein
MKYLLLLIFILSSSFAQNSSDIINRQIKDLEEKKVFEQQKIDEEQKDSLNFKDELLNINEDEWNGNLKSDTFISFSMLLLLSVTFLSSLQTQQEIILLNNYEI